MEEKVIQNIIENYNDIESSIVKQLNIKVDNHPLTAGYNREKIWLDLFRQIIPMKLAIKQGVFLIDSKRNVSKEVDIAVFDEQYTPYIFNYLNIHFIPIEAVAIVIQCKSRNVDNKDVNQWYESIDKLQTVTGGIARMAASIVTNSPDTQKATKPISILCHMKDENYDNDSYDLILSASDDKIEVKWNERVDTLEKAFRRFNGIPDESKVKVNNKDSDMQELKCQLDKLSLKGNSMLSLIFQLNQLLMLINNPMLFPHQAYVDMFNGIKSK